MTDAWVTLGGIALETSTLRLGTLMSSATFRLPGPLAVSVAQVDDMSGGRVELGLGAGWYEKEHRAFAIPFPGVGERFDRLEEQLEILEGLWATPAGGSFDYEGKYYDIEGCPSVFLPVQRPHPPVIIGGHGRRRTPELAARFAAEFNMAGPSLQEVVEQFARVDDACRAIGREPGSLTRSVWLTVCVGRDQAEFERRAAAIGREPGELRKSGIAGLPGEARAALDRFVARESSGCTCSFSTSTTSSISSSRPKRSARGADPVPGDASGAAGGRGPSPPAPWLCGFVGP